ncbi:MAG TPA: Trk system potassium transporter TrkA [Saprospiraceae bacterium]|nr:Trk system potassium transporter TrkA [Saprospiraceae bacterium]
MKIVIAGAGDIGFHLGKLLANEQHDIVLIDTNQEVLDYAHNHLDVQVLRGDATSINTLKQAEVAEADLFLAVTTSESSNIVSSILAKKFGAEQTVARVSNGEFLEPFQREIFQQLGIDKIFSPAKLAVMEIERLIKLSEVTDIFEFENGKITLLGISLDDDTPILNKSIEQITAKYKHLNFKPIAILRNNDTLIPRDKTILLRGDHIYLIVTKEDIKKVLKNLGKKLVKVNNIMILSGGEIAIQTAKLLENHYNVTIIDGDRNVCKRMAEILHKSLIVKGDPSDIDLLKEEGLEEMDAFIALTRNSETNIITSLVAEEAGVFKTIAMVDNIVYTHISQSIGVDTLINKKLIAANNVFRFVRKGNVEAITSIHGVDAEIIEYAVSEGSVLTQKALKDLNFPKHALIGGVIRDDEAIIPAGDFQLRSGDKVIVFAMLESIGSVEKLFLVE